MNLFLEAGLESDSTTTTSATTTVEDLEELVEGKVKAAYAAMLLGCLLRDNSANLKMIRGLLSKHKVYSNYGCALRTNPSFAVRAQFEYLVGAMRALLRRKQVHSFL